MISPRSRAQLGLGAAGLVLVSSMAVLVNGATDAPVSTPRHSESPRSQDTAQLRPSVASASAEPMTFVRQ